MSKDNIISNGVKSPIGDNPEETISRMARVLTEWYKVRAETIDQPIIGFTLKLGIVIKT